MSEKPVKNISIKDIAKASGFSVSTVSYALRDNPKISASTRKKIHQVAHDLDYQPDPAMRQFMSYVRERRDHPITRALGFLNTSPLAVWSDTGTRAKRIMTTIVSRAAHFGYHIDEFWIGDLGKRSDTLNRILEARSIQGLIMHFYRDIFRLPELHSDKLATVCFDHYPEDFPMHNVAHSNFRGMRLAVRELIKMGYRKIGLAVDNPRMSIARDQWVASFTYERDFISHFDTVEIYNGEIIDLDIHEKEHGFRLPDNTRLLERKSFLEWVDRAKPDCVLTYRHSALEWLREAGYRVPDDLGFALLDWSPEFGDICGVDQQIELIARTTVDTLIAYVESNQLGVPEKPTHIRLDGKWHTGTTIQQQ